MNNQDPLQVFKQSLAQVAIAQTETKQTPQQQTSPDPTPPWLAGSGLLVGGAAIWAIIAKFLERYGNSTLNAREQKIKQDLEQSESISKFYLHEANRDSETINTTLNLFITKHLDTTKQLFDMYYDLLERYKKMEEEMTRKNEELVTMRIALRDIFEVLSMRERQSLK